MPNVSAADLFAAIERLDASPKGAGPVELIVRRPDLGERESVASAELTPEDGLVGDNWRSRGSRHTEDGSAEVGRQLTIMNSRAADAFAGGDRSCWSLAGDQLYVDLHLGDDNLPAGTRIRLGDAVVEVSELPHTGCAKFRRRFGPDASRFIGSEQGQRLRVGGINARVVVGGTVRVGDVATKLAD